MQDEFLHWKRVGKTYTPSFTAFVIQSVEAEANHRLGAGGRRLRRGGLMIGVAVALQRQQAKSAGKLSRRARRIRPRAAVGPTMETSLPRGLVALMDEAQKWSYQLQQPRHAYLRYCVQQGLDRLKSLERSAVSGPRLP